MGSSNSKDNLESRFTDIEQLEIRKVFCAISNCKDDKMMVKNVTEKEFHDYVGNLIPATLTKQFYNITLSFSSPKGVNFYGFAKFLNLTIKGTFEERGKLFSQILTTSNDSTTIEDLKLRLEEIASSLSTILSSRANAQSWNFSDIGTLISRLSKIFFLDLLRKEKDAFRKWESATDNYYRIDIENWFGEESLLTLALCEILNKALPVTRESYVNLPLCAGANWSKFQTLLDFPSLWKLNLSLPPNLRETWQLLYSSSIHGESFSTLLGHVLKKGPTILIVKDKDGYIFGGFASISWDYKPKFTGTEDCFVFQLFPEIKVYESSGFNNNYMYLCLHQHTLPNGLGFGGQLNNFGLWIDAEFDHGHSILSCATYKSEKLSCQEQFRVDTVEVWRVGEPPKEEDENLPKKSVLDSDVTAKAMLTMVNKIGQSDGLRELGPQEDEEGGGSLFIAEKE